MHYKIVLLVTLFAFAVGCRLLDFSLIRLWVILSFQMTDSLAALFHCLCVSGHECNSGAFLEEIEPVFCAASCMVGIFMKLADTKLESSEAYLIKYGKNLSSEFKIMDIFCTFLKYVHISKDFTSIIK